MDRLTRSELLKVYRRLGNPKRDLDSVFGTMEDVVDSCSVKPVIGEPNAWRVGGRLFSNKADAEKVGKASGVGVVPLYRIPPPPGPQGGPTIRGMSLDETLAYIEKLEAENEVSDG